MSSTSPRPPGAGGRRIRILSGTGLFAVVVVRCSFIATSAMPPSTRPIAPAPINTTTDRSRTVTGSTDVRSPVAIDTANAHNAKAAAIC